MSDIQHIEDSIGLENYMNAVLVKKEGRPAFMIQPSDYDARKAIDADTRKTLDHIQTAFPELYQLKTGWGIILSKKKISLSSINDDYDIGKILGYPCYKDFKRVQDTTENRVSYEIIVTLKWKGIRNSIQLFANLCKDQSSYPVQLEIKKKIEAILTTDEVLGDHVESVELHEEILLSPMYLLQSLRENKKITDHEKETIINHVWNLGFSHKIIRILEKIDINTTFHRGVLCTLLAYYIHNPLEPFYPLQNHDEQKEVVKNLEDLEGILIQLLSTKGEKKKAKKTQKKKTQKKKKAKKTQKKT